MDTLDTLTAIEEIRLVEARYARFADEKDWSALAGLFTDDGTFEPRDADGKPLVVMNGRQAIADTLNAVSGRGVTPIHMFFTTEIEIISATEARGVQSMADLLFRGPDAPPSPGLPDFTEMQGWGHYHSTYVKVDGAWFIKERVQTRTRLVFLP